MVERLVVIGGDAAGMSAAAQARRRRGESQLEIVAFERGGYTSYSACGLPYFVADMVSDEHQLIARTPEEHRAAHIDVQLHHEVVSIDTDERSIVVRDLHADAERTERYDQLVIATGATPRRPDLPGADAGGIHGIQTIADGLELRAHVDAHPGHEQAVVVGGGYVGLEMAEAMHARGFNVTLVDGNEQPMTSLDPDMGEIVADAMRSIGITVHCDERVRSFEVRDGNVAAVVTDETTYEADIVVLGMGVRPNSGIAADAGIAVGDTGGIAVSPEMRTSAPGVFAAGDCVEVFHRVARRHALIALGTHANKQGRVVGTNATGGSASFPGGVGTSVTKVCEFEIGRAGVLESEAVDLALDPVSVTVESTTRAGYFPGAQPITVKLIAERASGRLLGGQIVGKEGAAKRIDIVAMALWNGMTVADLSQTDLGYAPPFSPVWDPVLIAARKLARA